MLKVEFLCSLLVLLSIFLTSTNTKSSFPRQKVLILFIMTWKRLVYYLACPNRRIVVDTCDSQLGFGARIVQEMSLEIGNHHYLISQQLVVVLKEITMASISTCYMTTTNAVICIFRQVVGLTQDFGQHCGGIFTVKQFIGYAGKEEPEIYKPSKFPVVDHCYDQFKYLCHLSSCLTTPVNKTQLDVYFILHIQLVWCKLSKECNMFWREIYV